MEGHVYETIRKLVHAKAGIDLGENREVLLTTRLAERLRSLQLKDEHAYLNRLREDHSEIGHLIDVISTNHTHFFREPAHFDFVAKQLSELASSQTTFRFWCAACSSGEEPYSLAMHLLEIPELSHCNLKILATDVSQRILRTAMMGRYSQRAIESVPFPLVNKYFLREPGGTFTVKPVLQSLISFRHHNLTHLPSPVPSRMDFVLCRNVMIYFDEALRKKLVREFARVLNPGRYLLIGHSESLTGMQDPFLTVKPAVYQKPVAKEATL